MSTHNAHRMHFSVSVASNGYANTKQCYVISTAHCVCCFAYYGLCQSGGLQEGRPTYQIYSCYIHRSGPRWLSRYSDCLRVGLSGDRIPVWGRRFSAPVQTGPEAHPASCTMGTGSFPGVRCGRGVTLIPHPLLVPRSKIE